MSNTILEQIYAEVMGLREILTTFAKSLYEDKQEVKVVTWMIDPEIVCPNLPPL